MSSVRKNVLVLNYYRAYLAKVPYTIIILKCLICTDFESYPNNSSVIAASITSNGSLEILWPVLSKECLKYSSGVWIRVAISNRLRTQVTSGDLLICTSQVCKKEFTKHLFNCPSPAISNKRKERRLLLYSSQKSHPMSLVCS
jgi:hypothetical protein